MVRLLVGKIPCSSLCPTFIATIPIWPTPFVTIDRRAKVKQQLVNLKLGKPLLKMTVETHISVGSFCGRKMLAKDIVVYAFLAIFAVTAMIANKGLQKIMLQDMQPLVF